MAELVAFALWQVRFGVVQDVFSVLRLWPGSTAPPRRCGALQEGLRGALLRPHGCALLLGLGVLRPGVVRAVPPAAFGCATFFMPLLNVVVLLLFVVAAVLVLVLDISLLLLLPALHYGRRFVLIVGVSIFVAT